MSAKTKNPTQRAAIPMFAADSKQSFAVGRLKVCTGALVKNQAISTGC